MWGQICILGKENAIDSYMRGLVNRKGTEMGGANRER